MSNEMRCWMLFGFGVFIILVFAVYTRWDEAVRRIEANKETSAIRLEERHNAWRELQAEKKWREKP